MYSEDVCTEQAAYQKLHSNLYERGKRNETVHLEEAACRKEEAVEKAYSCRNS